MAGNANSGTGLSSVFPPPPIYYKYFTSENLEKFQELTNPPEDQDISGKEKPSSLNGSSQNEGTSAVSNKDIDTGSIASTNLPQVSNPSQFLALFQPPVPPSISTYRSFGNVWQVDDELLSLSELGITQLYDLKEDKARDGNEGTNEETNEQGQSNSNNTTEQRIPTKLESRNRVYELKKLVKSLLIHYLELVGIMSIAPEQFPSNIENIRIILINLHHLLNEYRPHQSRESLILLMEDQVREKRTQVAELRKSNLSHHQRILSLANEFRDVLPEQSSGFPHEPKPTLNIAKEDLQKNMDQYLWSVLR